MFPIQKIVVPTDFSEPSYEALKTADELASRFEADLVLIHAVPPVPYYGVIPVAGPHFEIEAYQKDMVAQSEKKLQELREERISGDVRCTPVVRLGDAPATIIELTGDEKADVIVISTHGRTGWKRFMFGSVAEKVVRTSPCPVLTVPDPKARAESS
jgi:nucleotide-binding universal stress UspA family protein